jgi:hypothetical protein
MFANLLSGAFIGLRRRDAFAHNIAIEALERRLCLSSLPFLPAVHYDAGGFSASRLVAIGDVNGDHKPDLVSAAYDNHSVSVLLNKGGGAFSAGATFDIGEHPVALAMGDFNHDGALDLAVVVYGGTPQLDIFLGVGNGSFLTVPATYEVGTGPTSVAVGDFTGDEWLDLAVTDYNSHTVKVLLNFGNGTFGDMTSYNTFDGGLSVVVGDFDGDRVNDLAVGCDAVGNGIVAELVGLTNVDPSDPQNLIPNGSFAYSTSYTAGQGPDSIAPGFPDFNGDGNFDLAVANVASGTVSVRLGVSPNAGGGFGAGVDYVVGDGPDAVATADFTGDGHDDMAVATNAGVTIRAGNGNGTFQLPQTLPLASANGGSLAVADFNGDGKPDIAVTDFTGVSVLLEGVSDKTAPTAALAAPPTPIGSAGAASYNFTVKYSDNQAVKASTLATGAVRVSGPGGFTELAALVSVNVAGDGTPRIATYRLTPPGGTWDAKDNGSYTLLLVGGKVSAAAGNFAAAATLGAFKVAIPVVGSIAGNVFNDANSNGVKDAGEKNLAGVRIYIDANKNGAFNSATEKSVLSDALGNYKFTGLAAGAYRVREVTPLGRRLSGPATGFYDIALAGGAAVTGKNFANTANILISGAVFNDANGDKIKEASEAGLAGWRVYIDANHDGAFESTERSVLTNAAGNWSFSNLAAGSYVIRVSQQSGYTRTTPTAGSYAVSLTAGQSRTAVLFGEKKL